MFGLPKIPWGPLGIAGGTDTRPTNSAADTAALQKLLAETKAANRTPNGRVARGWDQFGPQPSAPAQPAPPKPIGGPATPFDGSTTPSSGVLSSANLMDPQPTAVAPQAPAVPPAASAPAPVAMPMPAPRPPEAPQAAPDMGFFQRNAAMMQDPNNPGSFIDPAAAQRADASGPDVIQKLLNMFHQKDA